MADGIAAGGAGVRHDRDRPIGTEGVQHHSRLDLGLIVNGPGGLMAMAARFLQCLTKIGFAE